MMCGSVVRQCIAASRSFLSIREVTLSINKQFRERLNLVEPSITSVYPTWFRRVAIRWKIPDTPNNTTDRAAYV